MIAKLKNATRSMFSAVLANGLPYLMLLFLGDKLT